MEAFLCPPKILLRHTGFISPLPNKTKEEHYDVSKRISGKSSLNEGKARKAWEIGKKSGPAGYYSKGHYETLDEHDGLATYEDYRGYYDASKKKK